VELDEQRNAGYTLVNMPLLDRTENPMIWDAANEVAQATRDLTPVKSGQNLIENSSFEQNLYPFMPDNWIWGYGYLYRNGFVGGQTAPVYHGKYSAMLTHPSSLPAQYRFWTSWKVGQTYTLSAYVKSEAAAAKFRLCLNDSRRPDLRKPKLHQDFDIGADWRRVEWTFTVPKGTFRGPQLMVGVQNLGGAGPEGPIWVDAVQLELGDRTTEYKPDGYRSPRTDPKWFGDAYVDELESRYAPTGAWRVDGT